MLFSKLKLRGSWGLVGNDQINGSRFIYMSQIDLGGKGFTTGVNQNVTYNGPVYQRYANEDITWEVGKKDQCRSRSTIVQLIGPYY